MTGKAKSHLTADLRQRFPKSFLWGASVSPHQVEGDTYNQWTQWELHNASDNAKNAEAKWSKALPVWEDVKHLAVDPNNYISGHADKHYRLYEQDFKLARSLGLNTFRFSLEWSRIEPKEGVYNLEVLQHYKRYITAMIDAGLEPIVGLWHWTVPVWFEDKGGFLKKANLKHWQKFVEKVADELEWSEVKYATTLNEANSYAVESYLLGEFPPGRKNLIQVARVYKNLALAHRIAWQSLSRRHPHLQVGVVHHLVNFKPYNPKNLADRVATKIADQIVNWLFLKRCRNFDFLGINFYRTEHLAAFKLRGKNPYGPLNDLGWYMRPEDISVILKEAWRRYKKPIIVTENGVADMHDKYRLWWIGETMKALDSVRQAGVNLLGYCHWSLLDNFEWQFGWFPKFGLVAVDRQTFKRTVKQSTKTWAGWLLHR